MGRWLVRRLIITVITFIGITMLVFVLMRLAPVDPVDMFLNTKRQQGGLTSADIERIRATMAHALGLDQPIPIQYLVWLKEAFTQGSLGFSFITGRPSLDMVVERIPPTLILMVTALALESF